MTLVGCALSGGVAYCMGVRTERGRHARWTAIQEMLQEERRQIGGVVLKRIRVGR